jgi:hypothetical protein
LDEVACFAYYRAHICAAAYRFASHHEASNLDLRANPGAVLRWYLHCIRDPAGGAPAYGHPAAWEQHEVRYYAHSVDVPIKAPALAAR